MKGSYLQRLYPKKRGQNVINILRLSTMLVKNHSHFRHCLCTRYQGCYVTVGPEVANTSPNLFIVSCVTDDGSNTIKVKMTDIWDVMPCGLVEVY
jgi:hypothetical protein